MLKRRELCKFLGHVNASKLNGLKKFQTCWQLAVLFKLTKKASVIETNGNYIQAHTRTHDKKQGNGFSSEKAFKHEPFSFLSECITLPLSNLKDPIGFRYDTLMRALWEL